MLYVLKPAIETLFLSMMISTLNFGGNRGNAADSVFEGRLFVRVALSAVARWCVGGGLNSPRLSGSSL